MTHTPADLDALEKLAEAARGWPPLGEPCHVPNFRHGEWRTIQLFFAGITYRPGLVPHVDVWLAEKWPPEHLGHITDGFSEDDRASLAITDEIVERTARAICIANGESPDAAWRWADNEGTRIPFWKKYVPHATAALAPAPTEQGKT